MDRQDIDALLIGALYGELTPAEEARLAAHLESHPTDRGALDDLKTARQAVRDSRIFEAQVDPPQHLSALLLQEAHRRAPKRVVQEEEKEGWFARFMRSFMAHPAMAAAAMLVLVVGVAGTLYMRKGADFATHKEMDVSTADHLREENTPAAQNAAPTGATGQAEGMAAGSAAAAPQPPAATETPGDSYRAGLYDKNAEDGDFRKRDGKQQGYERKQAEATGGEASSASDRWANQEQAKTPPATPQKKGVRNGIVVATPSPEPKELENGKDTGGVVGGAKGNFELDGADDSVARNTTRAGAGGGANAPSIGTATTSTGSSNYANVPKATAPGRAPTTTAGPYAQPPAPPPPANDKASVAQRSAAPTSSSAGAGASKAESKPAEKPSDAKVATKGAPEQAPAQTTPSRQDSTLVAWAKGQHEATKALVRKGDCLGASKLALKVSNDAPDYYSKFMATDRDLKSCMAYINNERDKDAEKSAKSRAQKRVNADEVQSAPAPSK